ncbi:hypothetical protein DPMN_155234 [Dreissena polymorpha]|uniref:Uncharacterized protein n=1 Tax=Dreissena polymorpha TaxID=45954 RepID=A0A9D4FTA9_DREPO|nr:hypothetical protein DPMN_155212 [Dreissena polymorpha]KAH3801579.1 hypothetical protein DPMN_155234 [Dreissena polymorpha]
MSSVWLEFHSCCSLNNYSNHSHFHLGRIEVSTSPLSGLCPFLLLTKQLFQPQSLPPRQDRGQY